MEKLPVLHIIVHRKHRHHLRKYGDWIPDEYYRLMLFQLCYCVRPGHISVLPMRNKCQLWEIEEVVATLNDQRSEDHQIRY